MEHFNSPPGWPRPPWNWRPEPGWRPDPSWPAPPQGWNFWVDDYGYPTAGPRGLFGTEAPDSSNSATRALPLSEPSATTTSQQPQYLVSPTTQQPTQGGGGSADYPNCAAVRAAGAAPIHAGEPGYSLKLDRDGDGVACE